jgi:hypothetical protein
MRIYDVYRGHALRSENLQACIRVNNGGKMEWAFRPEEAEWQGFWWSDDVISEIQQMIKAYPALTEFPVSDFMIYQRDN